MKKCLFLNNREPYPEDIFNHLSHVNVVWYQDNSGSFSLEKILETHNDTEILITTFMNLDASNLSKLPQLEFILATTTETSYIDREYCHKNNIKVVNTPKYTGASVAEHAVALMLSAAKRIVDFNTKVRSGDFQLFEHQGMELSGKKVGIIGMGDIGKRIAKILQGFEMKVKYSNRSQLTTSLGIQTDLNTLLSESDVIFLTLPLNQDTKNIINFQNISQIKKGAILINISPDKLIEFNALKWALEDGKLSYAGIDLLSEDEKYFQLPNLIITPRRGWYTKESFTRRIKMVVETLTNYLRNF
ncbi:MULTISPECIES: 2-hydroxyacid dehydrogenase [unclassified Okeania]|uniref:2-hydroxyacid dehydrogenase n=1 Tax=unclassified Okeania TaxID=2634635 RepID=UPI0013B8540B|nr:MULTISPECIES: 2-hydroxyacid dehydrogenase [unclassified Okeania]NET11832.1 hydroxyacid dehydrogenase [Okeania sp. SIO1H6]NEQ76031.1 hydroxyacid dehydrogenase [Okeania sp. SIO2C9]NES74750.1 hydroxyacid dehydrogenase [Okeania sp. SIO1H4]NET18473.1 hydroxyacid dehydrogenase [Okeania sp. SIO1H5]NET93124.1 hydroxyacid dehydrogenase [Okeania sp. SIO1H2]